jgi:sugar transferase (PEP-CTERM system associated)
MQMSVRFALIKSAPPAARAQPLPSEPWVDNATPGRPLIAAGAALLLLDIGLTAGVWMLAVAAARPLAREPWLLLPPAGYLLFLYALGLHRRAALLDLRRSAARVPLAAVLGAVLAWACDAILPLPGFTLPAMVAAVAGCSTAGIAARAAFALLRHRRLFQRRVLVIGAGRRAWDLVWLLRKEGRTLSYDIVFVADAAMGEMDQRLVRDQFNRIFPAEAGFLAIARRFGADEIVVAADERRGMRIQALLACRTAGYPVSGYLGFLEREIRRIDLRRLELGWLLYADGFSLGPLDRALKRALDITVSATVLLLASPFLLAAALAINLADGGPVLYRQARVTRGGRVFRILKLRTMRPDAERDGIAWAAPADARVTRVGKLLRRTRLDEVPQLLNILAGDMSFVGPRPERPEFVADLIARLPLYAERHVVKAGLTGWAQVNYPYGASLDDARSKLSYDLYYVKNVSVLFDLLIILQTIRVVLWPDGAR